MPRKRQAKHDLVCRYVQARLIQEFLKYGSGYQQKVIASTGITSAHISNVCSNKVPLGIGYALDIGTMFFRLDQPELYATAEAWWKESGHEHHIEPHNAPKPNLEKALEAGADRWLPSTEGVLRKIADLWPADRPVDRWTSEGTELDLALRFVLGFSHPQASNGGETP